MAEQEGSRKRPPQYQINQRTINQQQQGDRLPNHLQNQKIKSEPTITNRKIFTVKKDNSETNNPQKTNFHLKTTEQSNINKPNDQKTQPLLDFTKNGIGLFSKPTIFSSNLFTNNTNQEAPKTQNKGFFFQNSLATNIFTSNKGTEQSASKLAAGALNGPSIFSKSIFNNDNKGTGPSLFKQADQDDDEGEEANNDPQLDAQQKLQIDKSKSSGTYVYENTSQVLVSKLVKKFKKNTNSVIESVLIEIHTDKNKKDTWLIGRMPQTKNIIFTGYIIKGFSTIRHINEKKQNIEIVVLSVKDTVAKKDTKTKDNLQKNFIRLQFYEEKDSEEVYNKVYPLI